MILAKAQGMNDALVMDNTKISLFPDNSAGVQKQRATFTDVNGWLRTFMQYVMLFPAKQSGGGETHFFEKTSTATQ